MAFFADADEVERYIGGVFDAAADHSADGPELKTGDLVMKVVHTDSDVVMNVIMREPYQVVFGAMPGEPDITLMMRAETADQFWRGEYNLAAGVAKGEVQASGPVNLDGRQRLNILKLVPLTKPLFALYRELYAKRG